MSPMTMGMRLIPVCLAAVLALSAGEPARRRYALILADPPVAERFQSAEAARSPEAKEYRRKLEASQDRLKTLLESMQVPVTGATQMVSNAIFVQAPPEREPELRKLP